MRKPHFDWHTISKNRVYLLFGVTFTVFAVSLASLSWQRIADSFLVRRYVAWWRIRFNQVVKWMRARIPRGECDDRTKCELYALLLLGLVWAAGSGVELLRYYYKWTRGSLWLASACSSAAQNNTNWNGQVTQSAVCWRQDAWRCVRLMDTCGWAGGSGMRWKCCLSSATHNWMIKCNERMFGQQQQ